MSYKKPILAIPKGRLQDYVNLIAVNKIGLDINKVLNEKNKYFRNDVLENVDLFYAKPKAIPQLLYSRFVEFGFCGKDIMANSGYLDSDFVELCDTGLDKVSICLMSNKSKEELYSKNGPIIVATEYEILADNYFTKRGIPHYILNTSGSTEGYIDINADCIVDVVETGKTAEANGLKVIDVIMESTLCLYAISEIQDAWFPEEIESLMGNKLYLSVEVDGNDGTGKSSVVNLLKNKYADNGHLIIKDRGILTKLTDIDFSLIKPEIFNSVNRLCIVLDCDSKTSQSRISKRDGIDSLKEYYHQKDTLEYYREIFLKEAKCLGIEVIDTEKYNTEETFERISQLIDNRIKTK